MKPPESRTPGDPHAEESESSPRGAGTAGAAPRTAPEGQGEGKEDAKGAHHAEDADGAEDELPEGLNRFLSGQIKQAGPYMDAVYGLVGAIFGLGLVGWLVDRAFGTAPRWLVAGVLTGVVIGMYGLGRVMLWRR